MSDPQTVSVYDDKAQDYMDMVSTDEPNSHLRAFMAALPEGGRALDFGCGPGNSAAMLRDAGFDVTALDASAKMVELGRKKYDIDIRLGTFESLTEVDTYDGIWASFSLLHAPRADMPTHLAAMKRALRPGGIVVIGLKTGTGESRDKIGRLYTYYTEEELQSLLRDAGFTPTNTETGEEAGLSGEIAPFMVMTAYG